MNVFSLHARWKWPETMFWLCAFAALFAFPRQQALLNEIAILGLFAMSLDLVLGYAGIVSLGQAAFLGVGAYCAGLFAKHFYAEPLVGLAVGGAAAGLVGFASSFLLLRGTDLTRLMVTLGVALMLGELANKAAWLTGGADGLQITMLPVAGLFEFDLAGSTAYSYSLLTLFALFLLARRLVHSGFGLSLRSIRENRLRAAAIGVPVNQRLVAVYTIAAFYAGVAGALLAQTTQLASLDVLEFHRSADVMLVLILGGTGYLYGGLLGAIGFKFMQDWLASITPQYWQFWIGLILVIFMLVGRDRLALIVGNARARLLGQKVPR